MGEVEEEAGRHEEDDDGEGEENKGETNAQLELMMMLLADDKERKEKRKIKNREKDQSDGSSEDEIRNEDIREEGKSSNRNENLGQSQIRGLKSIKASIRNQLDDFDHGLEGENRVLARAIEGGVEKHILTLTSNISDIGTIRYWKQDSRNTLKSVNEQLKPFSYVNNKEVKGLNDSIGHDKKHRRLKLFVSNKMGHLMALRSNFGCIHDGDPPDPQLFSNRFFQQLQLENDDSRFVNLPWFIPEKNEVGYQQPSKSLFYMFVMSLH